MDTTAAHRSDKDIIRLIREDERTGMQMLYDRYSAMLYGYLEKGCGSAKEAERLLAETLKAVKDSCTEYDEKCGTFSVWMLRMAGRKLSSDNAMKATSGHTLADIMNTTDGVESDDVCAKVLEYIFYRRYTAAELAAAAGQSEGWVRECLRRATMKMREVK